MKKSTKAAPGIIELGRVVAETKGSTGDIGDDVLKRPSAGLGVQ